MFTIKYFRPDPENTSALVIEYADRVTERFGPNGNKFVTLTRFPTGMSAGTTNETNILMDPNGKTAPSHIFVENMAGKTVQRIAAAV